MITVVLISVDIFFQMNTRLEDVYSLLSFAPLLAIVSRRLHDIGKSGYWGLVFFIPVVGPFWCIYLLVQPGQSSQLVGETI
ncbi:hypothetical protein GCM10027340_09530 [Marinomonas epiphytica]